MIVLVDTLYIDSGKTLAVLFVANMQPQMHPSRVFEPVHDRRIASQPTLHLRLRPLFV